MGIYFTPGNGERNTYTKEYSLFAAFKFFSINYTLPEESWVSRAPGLGKMNKHSSYFQKLITTQ